MRRLVLSMLVALSLLGLTAGSVAAKGPQPGDLGDHGWTCFFVPTLGVHCAPPGVPWAPPVERATPLLYWFESDATDVEATDLDFTGTELLVPTAGFQSRPCPQEDLDDWMDLGIARACHHN